MEAAKAATRPAPERKFVYTGTGDDAEPVQAESSATPDADRAPAPTIALPQDFGELGRPDPQTNETLRFQPTFLDRPRDTEALSNALEYGRYDDPLVQAYYTPEEIDFIKKNQKFNDANDTLALTFYEPRFALGLEEGVAAGLEARSSRGVAFSEEADGAVPRFDSAKLDKIINALGKQSTPGKLGRRLPKSDVEVIISDPVMDAIQEPGTISTGAYDAGPGGSAGTVVLRPNPSRIAVIEEPLHLGQHRKSGWSSRFVENPTNLRQVEVDAKAKMLSMKFLTAEERAQIEASRDMWGNR